MEYSGIVSLKEGYCSLLDDEVPLVLYSKLKKPTKEYSCQIDYFKSSVNLKYLTSGRHTKMLTETIKDKDGIPLCSADEVTI